MDEGIVANEDTTWEFQIIPTNCQLSYLARKDHFMKEWLDVNITYIRKKKHSFWIYKQDFTLYKSCIERREEITQREAIEGSFQKLVCDLPGWRVLRILC